MNIEFSQQRTAEDLRVIVLGLKMEEFNIDDEEVKNELYARVKRLPPPESINIMASNGGAMKDLESNIGYILDLIDNNNARDLDYKIRYKARTGLDPRHKVLDYKVTASKERLMKKEAANLVKELVRVSSVIDEGGHGKLSNDLIVIAKSIKDEEATESTFERFNGAVESLRLSGFNADADLLLREAGIWSGIKGLGREIGKGVAEMGKSVGNAAVNQFEKARGVYQLNNLKGVFERIGTDIAQAIEYAQQAQAQAVDPVKSGQIATIVDQLGKMQTMNQEAYTTVGAADSPQAEAQPAEAQPAEAQPAVQPSQAQPAEVNFPVNETTNSGEAPSSAASFTAGEVVTWGSPSGGTISGTVVGPAPDYPGSVLVQTENRQREGKDPYPINEQALAKAASAYQKSLSKQG